MQNDVTVAGRICQKLKRFWIIAWRQARLWPILMAGGTVVISCKPIRATEADVQASTGQGFVSCDGPTLPQKMQPGVKTTYENEVDLANDILFSQYSLDSEKKYLGEVKRIATDEYQKSTQTVMTKIAGKDITDSQGLWVMRVALYQRVVAELQGSLAWTRLYRACLSTSCRSCLAQCNSGNPLATAGAECQQCSATFATRGMTFDAGNECRIDTLARQGMPLKETDRSLCAQEMQTLRLTVRQALASRTAITTVTSETGQTTTTSEARHGWLKRYLALGTEDAERLNGSLVGEKVISQAFNGDTMVVRGAEPIFPALPDTEQVRRYFSQPGGYVMRSVRAHVALFIEHPVAGFAPLSSLSLEQYLAAYAEYQDYYNHWTERARQLIHEQSGKTFSAVFCEPAFYQDNLDQKLCQAVKTNRGDELIVSDMQNDPARSDSLNHDYRSMAYTIIRAQRVAFRERMINFYAKNMSKSPVVGFVSEETAQANGPGFDLALDDALGKIERSTEALISHVQEKKYEIDIQEFRFSANRLLSRYPELCGVATGLEWRTQFEKNVLLVAEIVANLGGCFLVPGENFVACSWLIGGISAGFSVKQELDRFNRAQAMTSSGAIEMLDMAVLMDRNPDLLALAFGIAFIPPAAKPAMSLVRETLIRAGVAPEKLSAGFFKNLKVFDSVKAVVPN